MPDTPSRRTFLRASTLAIGAVAAGAPLEACGRQPARAAPATGRAVTANVRVSHDGFTAHAEPYLAANPKDRANLLGACTVFRGSQRGFATYASFDAGATWRSNGLLPGYTPDYYANVTVAFDGAGTAYVSGWSGDRQNHPEAGGVRLWRSGDGGRAFAPPVTAAKGFLDHPALAADRSAGRTLYLAGAYFYEASNGLAFCRSTDGGYSFSRPRFIDPSSKAQGRLPVIAAGPDGTVTVAYFVAEPDGTNLARVISSYDRGVSFAAPVDLTSLPPSPTIGLVSARSCPAIAADPGGQAVYVALAPNDAASGTSGLQLYSSADQGRHWSAPIWLARSTHTVYFEPQVTVAARGQVAVSAFALTNGQIHVLLFASDHRQAFSGQPEAVTPQGFAGRFGLDTGAGYWFGGYQGLAATPGAFHPFWNDTRTGQLELFTASLPVA